MEYSISESVQILERTPSVLSAMLRGLGPNWYANSEGEDAWSAFDVVGHLVHGEETDWIVRARIILEHGTAQPFVPFDRFAQLERFKDVSLGDLLARFSELRAQNLAMLNGWDLSEAQLDLEGTHPEFGRVSLRQLLATWAVHDLNHIAQIARVMAKAYTDEVGPWRAYLSVLNR